MVFNETNKKILLRVSVPVILIVFINIYLLGVKEKRLSPQSTLVGQPLISFSDLYPVVSNKSGVLVIDKQLFMKAVLFFNQKSNSKAISDLVYLGQSNSIMNELNTKERNLYQSLIDHELIDLSSPLYNQVEYFKEYIPIVQGIASSLSHLKYKVFLFDTRNPLFSVLQVEASDMRSHTPQGNEELQIIKSQLIGNLNGSSSISKSIRQLSGETIQVTSIPLFKKDYGLVGIIYIETQTQNKSKN